MGTGGIAAPKKGSHERAQKSILFFASQISHHGALFLFLYCSSHHSAFFEKEKKWSEKINIDRTCSSHKDTRHPVDANLMINKYINKYPCCIQHTEKTLTLPNQPQISTQTRHPHLDSAPNMKKHDYSSTYEISKVSNQGKSLPIVWTHNSDALNEAENTQFNPGNSHNMKTSN